MIFQPSTYSSPSLPEDGTTAAAVAEVLDAIRENVLAANQLQVCSRADIPGCRLKANHYQYRLYLELGRSNQYRG